MAMSPPFKISAFATGKDYALCSAAVELFAEKWKPVSEPVLFYSVVLFSLILHCVAFAYLFLSAILFVSVG